MNVVAGLWLIVAGFAIKRSQTLMVEEITMGIVIATLADSAVLEPSTPATGALLCVGGLWTLMAPGSSTTPDTRGPESTTAQRVASSFSSLDSSASIVVLPLWNTRLSVARQGATPNHHCPPNCERGGDSAN